MKIYLKPIAAAVSLAVASMSAHASLSPPAIGTAAPPTNGLYLSVWDTTNNNSEVVNLSYLATDVTLASGALTPNSATSPFSTVLNPATGVGNVLQLNFGTIPSFSSLFGSDIANTDFMVTAAQGGGSTPYAEVTSAAPPVTAYAGLNGLILNVQGELSDWAADSTVSGSGVATDTTGTTTWSVQNGPLKGGQLITGQQFGGAVGSALDFYSLNGNTVTHTLTKTAYTNSSGTGFWFLSSGGVLSYDIPVASAVPLPAAVWLLGSGLLGLAGIGRRRIAAV